MSGRYLDQEQSVGTDLCNSDFELLEKITGRAFDFGVLRSDAGNDSTDWSLQKCLQDAKLEGKHAWLNTESVSELKMIASHLLEARRSAPYMTSACLLLPRSGALPQGFLQGWTRVLAIQKGQTVGSYFGDGETVWGPSNRLVQVYYLAPAVNPRSELPGSFSDFSQTILKQSKEDGEWEDIVEDPSVMLSAITVKGRLVMQMSGKVAGAQANCLFDTGSEVNVISKSFAERQGVVIQPGEGHIELGDSHLAKQAGAASVCAIWGFSQVRSLSGS